MVKFKVEVEKSLDESSVQSVSGTPLSLIEEKEKKNFLRVRKSKATVFNGCYVE